MKITTTILLFTFIISTEIIWGSQQIETVVFPSEDEIAEAFGLGEISFEQFIILTELIANQIEPSSFLLDEIPNSLLRYDTIKVSPSKILQTEYFINKKRNRTSQLTIRNQYASYIDEDGESRYQSSVSYKKDQYQLNFTLKKEFSGRERFTRRYISFMPLEKNYNITAGNFTKRFGLGGVIGYRGKLVPFSENIDRESFLHPDYGGFNGVYIQSQINNYALQSVTSFSRSDDFSFLTNAFMVQYKKNIPSLIIGLHEIKNINLNEKFYDLKTSLYKKFIYRSGQISTELVADFNSQNNSAAVLIDGKHKTKRFYLTYAFWKYGESFLNITGGSKTSLISEYVVIKDIQDTILSKRSNQIGGILKSKVSINQQWQIDLASIFAYKNSDTTELQLFTQLTRKLHTSTKLSLDLLYRNKEREQIGSSTSYEKYKSRLMLVHKNDNLYLRNYISALYKTDEPTYVGLFSEMKYRSENYGLIHLWLNFNRINMTTNQLDYYYGFLKNEFFLYNTFSISFKLSQRFSRSATDKHVSQFSLETSWQI